tara:strand:+ start:2208 stop:3380 length:1173 start_codon:yes stop_codon:yes gene_type:complete
MPHLLFSLLVFTFATFIKNKGTIMLKLKTRRPQHSNKKAASYFLILFTLIVSINVHAGPIRVSTGQGLTHQPYTTGIMNINLNNSDGLLFMAAGYQSAIADLYSYSHSDFITAAQATSPLSPIYANDIITTGDFLGSGEDQILAANPNNQYRLLTLRHDNSYDNAFVREDGDIDVNDRVLSGDFTGNGRDEVLLIKANGNYHTMQYNNTPGADINDGNFDILESGTSPLYWWNLSYNDQYYIGDFNGDGKDDLMALNPNGWMHLMTFSNGHWVYYAGINNGDIGPAPIDINNQYLVGDFDADGQDELFVMNDTSDETDLVKFVSGQWIAVNNNGSYNGKIGFGSSAWTISGNDRIFSGKFVNPYLQSINNRDMLLILNTTTSLYSIYYFD